MVVVAVLAVLVVTVLVSILVLVFVIEILMKPKGIKGEEGGVTVSLAIDATNFMNFQSQTKIFRMIRKKNLLEKLTNYKPWE